MSFLDGGILVGGDTPTPTPTPTPAVPILSTDRTLKGQAVAKLTISGQSVTALQNIENWELIGASNHWVRFSADRFFGVHRADPAIISGTHAVGDYYFNRDTEIWRGIFLQGNILFWDNWTLQSALNDANVRFLGVFTLKALADAAVASIDNENYAFFDGNVRKLQGDGVLGVTVADTGVVPDVRADASVVFPDTFISETNLGCVVEIRSDAHVVRSFYYPFGISSAAVPTSLDTLTLETSFRAGVFTVLAYATVDLPATPEIVIDIYIAEN